MLKKRSLGLAMLAVAATLLAPAMATAQSVIQPADTDFLVTGMAQLRPTQSSSNSGAGGVGFGVKGGLLYSSYRQAGQDFGNNNGWEAGIFFGGNRPGVLGVMGEVLYAKKGAKDSTGTITVDNYYLEIPILLRVNFGSSNRNTGAVVYAIGGPVFDVLLKAQQNNIDVKSNYESLDLGVIGGGGVEISRFLIEARLNWGLRNIAKANGGPVSDIKTRSFAVLAGFRFN